MTQTKMQYAFHSGEWAPSLNARVDLQKYQSGAALMRNYFVDYRGGASSRPGTKYVLQAFNSGAPVRCIPFQISPTVGYLLEFGQNYLRFHFEGATVLEAAAPITNITQANPAVVSVVNTLANGDWVYASGVAGMTQVNQRYFIVAGATAASVILQRLTGVNVSSTGYGAYTGGGTLQRVYKIASPYAGADLAQLKWTQDENKLYLFHPNYVPYVLTFISATNWTLVPIVFGSTVAAPTGVAVATTLSAGTVHYSYIVTAVDADGQESAQSVAGTLANRQDLRTVAGTNTVTWNAVAGASSYNVYKSQLSYAGAIPAGSAHGFVGNVTGLTFIDSFVEPDFAQTPPLSVNPIIFNPTTGVMYGQRLYLAAPPSKPNAFFASQPGAPYNYTSSIPAQPDDAIVGALSSNQRLTIQSMVGMPSGLIMFTDKVVQQLNAGIAGKTATAIEADAQPQSYVGASVIPPIVANFNILFVQQKNSIIRDITYNFNADIYTGVDISVLSSHFFFGFQIVDWAFAEEPFKLIWAIRNDGALLSLTYLKEQELIGWAKHDTAGTFKSVASVTEEFAGNISDATYFVVERGITKHIERLDDRYWTSLADAWTVDFAIRYSGAPATTIYGFDHLAGQNVSGLADGVPFTPRIVSVDGVLTLDAPASNVLAGLTFRPQLQTLPLDLGEPTIQGKRKNISAVTVRVKDTLGISIGGSLSTVVPMKGLIVGNLNEAMNAQVTGLVTSDARTTIDPGWTIPGQYFIDQPNPYPATILGVIPEITLGDGGKQG